MGRGPRLASRRTSTRPPVPQPYVLRKRLNVFGHNAPRWRRRCRTTFRNDYRGGDREQRTRVAGLRRSRRRDGITVDLDGSHPDIVAGSWVVLSKPTYRELWQVDDGDRADAGRVRGLRQGDAARR